MHELDLEWAAAFDREDERAWEEALRYVTGYLRRILGAGILCESHLNDLAQDTLTAALEAVRKR